MTSTSSWGVSTETPLHWAAFSQCLNMTSPDVLWPLAQASVAEVERGRAVCSGCPVRTSCLADAVENGEWDGIRGGLTGDERRAFHTAGLAPADYPEPPQRMVACARECGVEFPFNLDHPYATVCRRCIDAVRRETGRKLSQTDGARRRRERVPA